MFASSTKPSLYRDFLLLSVLIVLALLLVSAWIAYQTQQSHAEDVLQQLENEALRIDRALIIEIEHASYLLESIGRQVDTDAEDVNKQILRLFEAFTSVQPLRNSDFLWSNANQKIVMSGHTGLLDKPIDVSDRDYMKRSITTPWEIHIGQPVESRVSGRWVMPVAMGITDKDGGFLGVVSIGLNIRALSEVISNVIKDPDIDFVITNTAFTLLTQLADSPDFFVRYFSLKSLSDIDFARNPLGVFSRATWFSEDKIYSYYEQSSEHPYIIFVGYDPKASKDDIIGVLLPRLMQVGVMTMFLVLTLWTVRKRIIQPVMRLTHDTKKMLHGSDMRHDASRDPVEIIDLAEAISRLGAYINERRQIEQELASKNSDLMRIKEAAELTNNLKANFFEQVGEALMQPAKSISEYALSMRDELFGPLGSDKYIDMAGAMCSQSISLMEILGDIQAISKAETGLLALDETPVDLRFVINKCVRIMREKSGYNNVSVVLDLDDDINKIMADELRIKQLILNVLVNAASEVESNSTLRMNSYLSPDEIRIELTYKPSRGIPTRMEEFALGEDSSQHAANANSGFLKLGRALSELIIAMHGGSLTAKPLPDQMLKQIISIPLSRML